MAKVFTITPGLENLGALKTGGQGSVYQGRRIGEIITAIKLLPTPIYYESEYDKGYKDFLNEVEKLKKVNEEHSPNVVKILGSGLSETGNFPFIEMEYIEGPDLQELLEPPHDPVFTVKEAVKVAEQLSSALAHCHKKEVKHGDIKSNNVKFNVHSGNYVLLDFGLAVMSEEERRTSLRHAGAVEFMAPEQNDGEMLFQSDVYSFGVILFELLAGTVPFPLNEKGVTARNNIRLAHIEMPPPDILLLRLEKIPATWGRDIAEIEKRVPGWLTGMIYKCLEKKPENRFKNGLELNEFIQVSRTRFSTWGEQAHKVKENDENFKKEREKLQERLVRYRQELELTEREIAQLKSSVKNLQNKPSFTEDGRINQPSLSAKNVVSYNSFVVLLVFAVALAVFSAFSLFRNNRRDIVNSKISSRGLNDIKGSNETRRKGIQQIQAKAKTEPLKKPVVKETATDAVESSVESSANDAATGSATGKYKVISKAYFYDQPEEGTQRKAFINHWNNALLTPLDETADFIYIVFTNHLGQVSKGWLRKKDLKPAGG